jgi:ketosteroid isomerase-like protein
MNDDEMVERIRSIYEFGDMQAFARALDEMASDDMVQEWPQSGERIRGRANIAALNEHYEGGSGTSPKATLRRIVKPGDAWVIEATIDYGDGIPVSAVSIIETKDGKIVRQTDYFANPFEAPEWRSQWVEKMEPVSVG